MLHYTVVFIVIAIICGLLGFGFLAGTAAMFAKICFLLFLVMFLVSLLRGKKI